MARLFLATGVLALSTLFVACGDKDGGDSASGDGGTTDTDGGDTDADTDTDGTDADTDADTDTDGTDADTDTDTDTDGTDADTDADTDTDGTTSEDWRDQCVRGSAAIPDEIIPWPNLEAFEGYRPGIPERDELFPDTEADVEFIIDVRLLDSAGNPLPGETLQFWQARADGTFDFESEDYVGMAGQVTSDNGTVCLVTEPPPMRSVGGGDSGEPIELARTISVGVLGLDAPRFTTSMHFSDDPLTKGSDLPPETILTVTGLSETRRRVSFDLVVPWGPTGGDSGEPGDGGGDGSGS